jgi:hypothetical protein
MRLHALLILALLVSGCALLKPPPPREETPAQATQRRIEAPRPRYNLTGYPPAVKDGYIDGCESAKKSSYGRKDAKRMQGDPHYNMGWNDGFSICGKK